MRNCRLSLAIVIGHAASKAYSMEQGDAMLRLTKSFGPGPAPRKQIGEGIYDYLVGVYWPDETRVALGAKSRQARRLRW